MDSIDIHREVSLRDFVALCVRHLIVIIVFAIVCTAIFVGIHYRSVSVARRNYFSSRDKVIDTIESNIERLKSERDGHVILLMKYSADETVYEDKARFTDPIIMYANLISEVDSLINSEEKRMESYKNSVPPFNFMKHAVLGVVIGIGFAAILLLVSFLIKNPVTSSYDAESRLSVPFLGSCFIDHGPLAKLSRKTLCERGSTSEDDSKRFIENSFRSSSFNASPGMSIAVISSSHDAKTKDKADFVCGILKECGFESFVVLDVADNASAITEIESSSGCILVERQWVSCWQLVYANVELSGRLGKNILGFVLC